MEIQRLIGRALRQAVDMTQLGERTITLNCDVLEADGGTRTAAHYRRICGAGLPVDKLVKERSGSWSVLFAIRWRRSPAARGGGYALP